MHSKNVRLLASEMYQMLARYHTIDGQYRETKEFKRLFKVVVFEALKHTTTEEAAPIIHQCLKDTFVEPVTKVGIYKHLRYVVLPALWKDHVKVERKNKKVRLSCNGA